MIDFTQNKLYYSPNILIPTDRYDEEGNKIPDTEGFFWFITLQVDDPIASAVTIHVRCAVNDQQAETRTRQIIMPYEMGYQWTDEDCENHVLSQSIFKGSDLYEVGEESQQSSIWSKAWNAINPFKWFK